jgi:hypothetical protein
MLTRDLADEAIDILDVSITEVSRNK